MDDLDQKIEEAIKASDEELIEEYIVEHVKRVLGSRKIEATQVEKFLRLATEICTEFLAKRGPRISEHGRDVMSRVLALFWTGLPEDADLHALIRSLSDADLDLIITTVPPYDLSGPPLSLFPLEKLYREGNLGDDWSVKRISPTMLELVITPKEPLKYLTVNITCPKEEE